MVRPYLPLKALRAFEASARHLSFTRAAEELHVTQAAVSHQVKLLETLLKVPLFKRLPRGLMLTQEGELLLPVLKSSFDQIAHTLERVGESSYREVLNVGVVGTFAVGWLLPRLGDFQRQYPYVDLRLSTHNNRADIAGEGLDFAIRFGTGAWHGTAAQPLLPASLSVMCIPDIAARLNTPADVLGETWLRSYRADEWTEWLLAAGLPRSFPMTNSIVFDSSIAMVEAALQGAGVALAPPLMFPRQLNSGALIQPFDTAVSLGGYWLTRLQTRPETHAMASFREWLLTAINA
ncbi:LysR family transcriptional regulator [Vreelandella titanicae]|uniref:LysR family transcriptional regulator n=1 Tax=Halomonadaceae TaxID=28256 RepID=UPI00038D18C6|nr:MULTISPECIES: LysR family transcriptional regulator [Halomonas]NAO97762.1 LysR family transcriptional regulator [Halomonas sp. MG34]PKH62664.1 LysR family transcriptional regulator [Halomonas sp. Choline-3u-9]QGQ69115.1 LysR family transcriptional regulator [Halomonas sp. PA16-9]CDG52327.1 HTH-type transcriptional activator AmpR [Halomonas sp. A3H3]MCE7519343.1 LysR family transcriptional regulator [Halomonas titanicae]